jgi:hypothetical protein
MRSTAVEGLCAQPRSCCVDWSRARGRTSLSRSVFDWLWLCCWQCGGHHCLKPPGCSTAGRPRMALWQRCELGCLCMGGASVMAVLGCGTILARASASTLAAAWTAARKHKTVTRFLTLLRPGVLWPMQFALLGVLLSGLVFSGVRLFWRLVCEAAVTTKPATQLQSGIAVACPTRFSRTGGLS